MTIVLTYTKEDGTERQVEFEDDVSGIDLNSKKIANIDLSPLSSCSKLKILWLSHNPLQTIDIAPLGCCTSLKVLNLSRTQLETIDLTPLYDNQEIQLKVDCAMTAWLPREGASYQRPSSIYPWSFLYRVSEKFTSRRIQQDILFALGLGGFGFIDNDLRDIFLSIAPDTPTEEVKKVLAEKLLEFIELSVYNGGSTTGLNLDELRNRHGEIAVRTKRIIELREKEMELVELVNTGTRIYLNELWLTAYGYQVLSSMDVGLLIEPSEFERIQQGFKAIGFEIKTGVAPRTIVKMSDELKRCILWIAENRGRSWSKITLRDN